MESNDSPEIPHWAVVGGGGDSDIPRLPSWAEIYEKAFKHILRERTKIHHSLSLSLSLFPIKELVLPNDQWIEKSDWVTFLHDWLTVTVPLCATLNTCFLARAPPDPAAA